MDDPTPPRRVLYRAELHPVFLPCKYKTQMIHLSLFFYKISLYQMPAWRQTGKTAKCQSLIGQSKIDKMPGRRTAMEGG